MKRLAMILVLSTGLVAGPAMANHDGKPLLNRENVGGAIGAVIGGFAGNKLVNGDGKPLATAAGAVGGYIVGRDIGHNYGGGSYGRAGRQVNRTVYKRTSGYGTQRRAHNDYGCCDHDSRRSFPVHPINEKYIATCTSNVRTGPSTRYHVMDQVRNRELVIVIGKVRGRNWYKVRVGHRIGYVYAPLLKPAYYSQNRYNNNDGGWYR